MKFHTFQLKTQKPFKVAVRGIPKGYSEEEIKQEIEEKGYIVTTVHRAQKLYREPDGMAGVRKEIPIVFVDLKKTDNVKQIYETVGLFHLKVSIEPLKSKNWLPLCRRCQYYGHTKKPL